MLNYPQKILASRSLHSVSLMLMTVTLVLLVLHRRTIGTLSGRPYVVKALFAGYCAWH